MEETHEGEGIMANELACLNCGKGFIPTCHITRQKFCSSECRVRYNNAKRYYTDTPVNECPECGTPIQQSGEAGRWRQCEKEEACVPTKKSTVPPALLPGSRIVSASLLAQIMHSKYVLALPLYRQEQELHRLGLPVSRQSMSNWVLTAGERWLLPVYHALHKELLANKILHADETTLMVLREPERQALADELGEDGIQELAQRYAEAYEGCYDGAELDAYIEEICADAYAGMDRLPEAKTQIIQKAAQRAQDAQQTAEENGGTRGPPEKYSVGTSTDGTPVAIVDNDILSHIDTSTWDDAKKAEAKTAAKDALLSFKDGFEVAGVDYRVNRTSRREYTRSNDTERLYRKSTDAFADKMRSAEIADDIITATTAWARDGRLKHPRTDSFVDFLHGDVLIQAGDNQYIANTVVGVTENGEYVFYDVVDMTPTSFQQKTEPSTTASGSKAFSDIQESSDTNSIRSEGQKSQEKFSAAEDVAESDTDAEGTTAFTLDSIPKKAQDYLRRVRGQTAAAIQQTLSMPFAARQEVLKPAIEEMMNEYLQTGRISQETVDRSFEESYRRGVKRSTVRVRWEFSDTS